MLGQKNSSKKPPRLTNLLSQELEQPFQCPTPKYEPNAASIYAKGYPVVHRENLNHIWRDDQYGTAPKPCPVPDDFQPYTIIKKREKSICGSACTSHDQCHGDLVCCSSHKMCMDPTSGSSGPVATLNGQVVDDEVMWAGTKGAKWAPVPVHCNIARKQPLKDFALVPTGKDRDWAYHRLIRPDSELNCGKWGCDDSDTSFMDIPGFVDNRTELDRLKTIEWDKLDSYQGMYSRWDSETKTYVRD